MAMAKKKIEKATFLSSASYLLFVKHLKIASDQLFVRIILKRAAVLCWKAIIWGLVLQRVDVIDITFCKISQCSTAKSIRGKRVRIKLS